MKNAGDCQEDSEFQLLFSLIHQNNLKILHIFQKQSWPLSAQPFKQPAAFWTPSGAAGKGKSKHTAVGYYILTAYRTLGSDAQRTGEAKSIFFIFIKKPRAA